MLTHLGANVENEVIRAIYAFPTTAFPHSENLKAVINGISKIEWHRVGKIQNTMKPATFTSNKINHLKIKSHIHPFFHQL